MYDKNLPRHNQWYQTMPPEKKQAGDTHQKDKVHEKPSHAHDELFASKRNLVPAKTSDHHEEKKHLPKVEIVDHKVLQKKFFEKGHKPEERLEAAHKLYKSNHKNLSQVDDHGKTRHFQIVEKQADHKTRIAVLEIEGKKARLCLDGTVDKNGKYELAKPKEVAQAKEAQPAREIHAPRLDHSDNSRGHHSRLRRASRNDDNGDGESSSISRPRESRSERRTTQSSEGGGGSESFVPDRAPVGVSDSNARAILEQARNLPADKLTMLPNGMVYLRSKLAVDADGGPDWRSDPYGQAFTSLTNTDGSPLDATDINYFVLPMTDEYKKMGIKLGDLAWVRNSRTGKMVPAIFGDHGPKNKIGEGSQALCRALGLSGDPNSGGTSQKEIEFLIMPGSGKGKGNIAKSDSAMATKLAGITGDEKTNIAVAGNDVCVKSEATNLDERIKQAAINQAARMGGSKGINRCAEGVQLAMAAAGDKHLLGTGNGRAMDSALKTDPHLVKVDRATAFEALNKGHVAIVTREWTAARKAANNGKDYGHIEILMNKNGKVMGASDYYGEHRVQSSAYNWRDDHFYLPKAAVQNA